MNAGISKVKLHRNSIKQAFHIHNTIFYIRLAGEHLPYGCVEAGQEVGQGFSAVRVGQQTHDDDLQLCFNGHLMNEKQNSPS